MPSPTYIAKRALVTLIKFLAVSYSFRVDLSRDSGDADLRKAYRHLSRKVHPRDFENPQGVSAPVWAWAMILKSGGCSKLTSSFYKTSEFKFVS